MNDSLTHTHTITLLQEHAASAQPAWPKRKPGPVGRWSRLWPVYEELRQKGFTIREAVDWLIREGAVKEQDRKKAEYGLPMVHSRRRKEEAAKAGALSANSRTPLSVAAKARTKSRTRPTAQAHSSRKAAAQA